VKEGGDDGPAAPRKSKPANATIATVQPRPMTTLVFSVRRQSLLRRMHVPSRRIAADKDDVRGGKCNIGAARA